MARIFISHSSFDNEQAIAIRDWLVANGWDDIFLDLDPENGIVAGERWKDALKDAAHRCEAVLALVSPEWLSRTWCRAELASAEMLGKKIFVLLIGSKNSDLASSLKDAQYVDLINDPDAYTRLKEGLKRAGLDPTGFPFEEGRRPYPGFAPLEEEDAAIFFGRNAQIVRGLDKLRRLVRGGVERLLFILGASGSGKSSFLRAGLLPRLKRDDTAWLPLPTIRPERAVLSGKFGLADALSQIICDARFKDQLDKNLPRSRADIEELVMTREDGLASILNAIREAAFAAGSPGDETPPPTIVIPIDQGEELFNEESREEAERFIKILAGTLERDHHVLIILTMRTDSFPEVQMHPLLSTLPQDTFTLTRMPEGSYRTVIEGPARLVKPPLSIDPQLTEALLEDAAGQDALALLAFTLRHLYDRYQADNALTLQGYERLGRLKGVIEATVREALIDGAARGELPKNKQGQLSLIRMAFIPHLARVNTAGQFVRRVAMRSEISAQAHPLIDRFAEARLLIKDRRGIDGSVNDKEDIEVIEVAHEALLREWEELNTALKQESQFLIDKAQLERDLTDWQATPRERKKGALLAGNKLNRARHWLIQRPQDLTLDERQFIQASAAAESARRRWLRMAAATAFIVISAAGLFAGWQYLVARRAEADAEARLADAQRRQSLFLAQKASEAADRQEYTKALLIALEGIPDANREIQRPVVPEAVAQLERSLRRVRMLGVLPHSKRVNSARFSADGALVTTASSDGTAGIWESATGTEVARLAGHGGPLWFATFSPENRHVMTASTDRTARLWDIETGSEVAVFEGHNGPVWSAVFSPNGKFALTVSTDHTARLWDVPAGDEIAILEGHSGPVWSGAFSPDGRLAATASADGTVRIWNVEKGTQVSALERHAGPVWTVGFSPNGTKLVTASADQTARLWSADTGTEIAVLTGHEDDVRTAVFSPDGNRVVTASFDGTARLWDIESKSEKHVFRGHSDWVRSAAFALDGSIIVTTSEDGTVRLWDANSGKERAVYKGHKGPVRTVAVSPGGEIIVTASEDGMARLWATDTIGALRIRPRDGYWPRANFAGFSPNGDRVILHYKKKSASGKKSRRDKDYAGIWDLKTGEWVADLEGDRSTGFSAVFSPDGTYVVSPQFNGPVRVWDPAKNEIITVLGDAEERTWRPTIAPDSNRVATTYGSSARIWDARTGKKLPELVGHSGPIMSIRFSPSGDRLVTASRDGTARIWDSETGNKIRILKGHKGAVTSAVFSPDGSLVATGSWLNSDHTARVWDAETGKEIAVLSEHNAKIFSVAFSPDGTYVLTASDDNTARIWDSVTGAEVIVLRGHSAAVGSAMFSPDGTRVLTASADLTSRLWDSATGATIAVLEGPVINPETIYLGQGEGPPQVFAVFSPDGDRILTAGYTAPVVWKAYAKVQELVDTTRTLVPRCLTADERAELHLRGSEDTEPDPQLCMNETNPHRQMKNGVKPMGDQKPIEDILRPLFRLSPKFLSQLEAIREDGTVAAFISSSEGLYFHPDQSCVSDRTNLLIAKLRIFLSDIPHFGGRNTWAVQPFTRVISGYMSSRGRWHFGDTDVDVWLDLFHQGFPSISREDLSLIIDELLHYHRMITRTPEWRVKLEGLGTVLAGEKPLDYSGDSLGAMFHKTGFPNRSQPCSSATVTSVKPDFSNEDFRVSNEGWIYSFWSRRFMDGQFDTTKNWLDVLNFTISY